MSASFGHWHHVYVRYNRWSKEGNWQSIFEAFTGDADLGYLIVDGSIIRVHQHEASKKMNNPTKQKVCQEAELSIKIHAAVDSLRNLIRFS